MSQWVGAQGIETEHRNSTTNFKLYYIERKQQNGFIPSKLVVQSSTPLRKTIFLLSGLKKMRMRSLQS